MALAAVIALGTALPVFAEKDSLTISVGFGPAAEIPDPRAVVFLSERMTGWRIGGLALGFAGVLPELDTGNRDGSRTVRHVRF